VGLETDPWGDPDTRITLEAADGTAYSCLLLGVFDFEGAEYALLLREAEDAEDDNAPVIMRLIEQDGQAVFRTIEDDAEFEHVVNYVKSLAEDLSDD
jgi:hypothetical protein